MAQGEFDPEIGAEILPESIKEKAKDLHEALENPGATSPPDARRGPGTATGPTGP